jgi:D-alanyl-D-alanine carboxypeptidase/D-alanyl-D-alanine-endopeptidase (penicillin-binding protein 4)
VVKGWLITGGILLLGAQSAPWVPMRSVDWSTWNDDTTWVSLLGEPNRVQDPVAIAATQQHLQTLATLGLQTSAQGIWLQAGNEVLAEHRGTEPIPAASLTKIPTTLAALTTWGADHRFETVVGMQGTLRDGVIEGNLVIEGGGDPLFVWEEAIALGAALQRQGIQQVTGDLIISGNFAMNFEASPGAAGALLRQGMNADLWSSEAASQYRGMTNPPSTPRIRIEGVVRPVDAPPAYTSILSHQSLSLTQILKAMNIYSNNFIADWLAEQLGGGANVAQTAAAAAAISPNEVILINGSGLGEDNRISPRAVTAMLMTLQHQLKTNDLNVADFFPVVGRERGTLGSRAIVPGAAIKTGTLNRVSSLAGVVPTRDRGLVWFAIFDIGGANLTQLHSSQDQLLQTLVNRWGEAEPLPPDIRPSDRLPSYFAELGDARRNIAVP